MGDIAEGANGPRRLLDKDASAEYLGGVCTKTLDRLRARKKRKCVRVGGRVMFAVDELDEFIRRNAA
jgi:hypothetical protein